MLNQFCENRRLSCDVYRLVVRIPGRVLVWLVDGLEVSGFRISLVLEENFELVLTSALELLALCADIVLYSPHICDAWYWNKYDWLILDWCIGFTARKDWERVFADLTPSLDVLISCITWLILLYRAFVNHIRLLHCLELLANVKRHGAEIARHHVDLNSRCCINQLSPCCPEMDHPLFKWFDRNVDYWIRVIWVQIHTHRFTLRCWELWLLVQ